MRAGVELTFNAGTILVHIGALTLLIVAMLLHFTDSDNVEAISQHGLIPSRPYLEVRTAVWLVAPQNRHLVKGQQSDVVVFEVNEEGLDPTLLEVDKDQRQYMIYRGTIPPEHLRFAGMLRWGIPFEMTPADVRLEIKVWFCGT